MLGSATVFRRGPTRYAPTGFVQGFTDVPHTIPSKLALWLRADKSVTLDGSGNVSNWQSLEGSRYDFAQTTESARPVYVASGPINSLPAINFVSTDALWHGSAILTGSSGTLYCVARMTATGAFPVMFSSAFSFDEFLSFYGYGNGAHPKMGFSQRNLDTEDGLKGSTTTLANTPYVYRYSTNGTTTTMRLNANGESVSAFSGSNNGDWFGDTPTIENTTVGARKIGGSFYNPFNGHICEVIAFEPELTSAEMTAMTNYLGARYSLAA